MNKGYSKYLLGFIPSIVLLVILLIIRSRNDVWCQEHSVACATITAMIIVTIVTIGSIVLLFLWKRLIIPIWRRIHNNNSPQ